MESESLIAGYQPSSRERVLAAVGPVLWIAISYVDPGKWAATVEGGARFGFDLSLFVLLVNCAAILCQYLSARVAIATGKNLAQICSEEYDDMTCILLGTQAEISMVALDLTMVLGTAYGLNAVFGIDIFNCVILAGLDATLFPFFAGLLENPRAKIVSICLACLILLSFVSGVLISQPESSLSMGGMLSKLTGENAYALMSVLGANIMPHNFYLHSSIVQRDQGQTNVSKGALCLDQFFATLCIFSGIFLLNCMLMNLAANVFYGSGIDLLTFQDALSLLDQVYRSSIASVVLIFIMFFSNQLVALTWSLERQVVTHDLFRLEIPCWLHRSTIRIVAIIPALFCVWNSGADGIFQLLIFTQVIVALLLPSSVIPLFRVASSRSIMGTYKISALVEILALLSFVVMLGIKIVFIMEMVFGSSDWVASLKWNFGSSVSISYPLFLIAAFASLSVTLWLASIPLKSASSRVDTQALKWDKNAVATELSIDRDQSEISKDQYEVEKAMEKQEPVSSQDKSRSNNKDLSIPSPDLNLPEMLLDSQINIQENRSELTFSNSALGNPEAPAIISEVPLLEPGTVIINESLNASTLSGESKQMVEKKLKIDGVVLDEKDDEVDLWEPGDLTKDDPERSESLTSEVSGSYKSHSGKVDDVGSGAGSLSRMAGLGRAARRQLAAILDEFWGQLFDFHGQATNEAKANKMDVLLGVDFKVDTRSSFAPVKLESISKESTEYFPSTGGKGSDFVKNPSFISPSMQQIGQGSIGSPLGVQQGSSLWSSQMQPLDAYIRDSNHNAFDSSERRYRSMHTPSPADVHDQQPATIHGYDLAKYLGRVAKEKRSDYLKGQLEPLTPAPTPSIKSNSIESYSRSLAQKPQNGQRTLTPPGFHNIPVSRNSSLNSQRPFNELSSPESMGYTNNTPHVKKFFSLPDISGLYIPQRNSFSGNSSQWEKYVGCGHSINRLAPEGMSLGGSSRAGTPVGFNQHSPPSKVCRDAFSLQFGSSSTAGSLWSKQPYEQFGVADKPPSKITETVSIMDMEAKLVQSFRSCIVKLIKLEGSDWLFRQNDGADEDLIGRVSARERFLYEAETRTLDGKLPSMKIDVTDHSKFMPVPNCGDGCVWRADLIISFGVWCIHRILELSLMESRPELWGKYTYVLNRLQGIIDPALSKPRSAMVPCFCLQLPVEHMQKSSPPISNGSLPPQSKLGRGKFTTAAMLLELIKDVETAISCRKGRTGTAAGDVAFPKGKENLVSVLKRYKRRLSNRQAGSQDVVGHGSLKNAAVLSRQGL